MAEKRNELFLGVLLLGLILAVIMWFRSHEGYNVLLTWAVVCATAVVVSMIEDRRLQENRYASPVLFVLLIMLIGESNFLHIRDRELIVSFLCLYSTIYFMLFIFKGIAYSAKQRVKVTHFYIINQIILTAGSGIIVFAITYTELFRINPELFVGANLGTRWIVQFFNFLYFTLVTFATVGYGDIHPGFLVTRLLVSLQIFFAFITFGYSISLVAHLLDEAEKSGQLPVGGNMLGHRTKHRKKEEQAGTGPAETSR
ncbi:MAG: potassium channel family protein [Chloroflexi bacterium]|nr:potassium channel family protein [Chloroflexota bacterium]